MRRAIILLAFVMCASIAILSAGCDSGDKDDVSGKPPSVNVAGSWTGTIRDVGSGVNWVTGMSANLSQRSDGTVQGTVYRRGYGFTSEWPSTGLVEANRLTLTSSTGVYTLTVNGDSMTGTYAQHDWEHRYQDVRLTRSSN